MVIISSVGYATIDYLFSNVDYSSEAFKKGMSKEKGDGGLNPGGLVFAKDWVKYTGKGLEELRREQGWLCKPNSENLGGPCVVALINAAQLTSHLDCKVKYYCTLGNDDKGKKMLNILKKTPVDVSNVHLQQNKTSPCSFCLSDPTYFGGVGERCFVVDIGLFHSLTPEEVITDDFFEGDILFFSATALMPHFHAKLTSLLRRGKQKGKINVVATVFDHISESKNQCKRWSMGESDDTFKYIDVLIVDMEEALGISGTGDVKEAVFFFIDKGVKSFIITHGAHQIWAWSDGTFFKKMDIRMFPISQKISDEIAADVSKRGDTIGCGDNFAGGVLSYLAESLTKGQAVGEFDLQEAVTWGVASGGFACLYLGGTYLEKQKGEKRKLIEYYRHHYISQLQNSKL